MDTKLLQNEFKIKSNLVKKCSISSRKSAPGQIGTKQDLKKNSSSYLVVTFGTGYIFLERLQMWGGALERSLNVDRDRGAGRYKSQSIHGTIAAVYVLPLEKNAQTGIC